MRSPSAWSHGYNFGGGMYNHNLSPTSNDSYGGGMLHNNNYNQVLPLNIKSGHTGSEIGLQGNYNDPRMFGAGQLSHNRNSPTNSNGANSPPQSLSNAFHTDGNLNVNANGLPGSHSYQNSNMHGANPAHSFLGTNSVTINNNYLLTGGTLNLPFKSYSNPNGITRTGEEDANNNQLGPFYRPPPTLYEGPGNFGYQGKHGYESHIPEPNGHHGDIDDNVTPKVWRPY